MSNILECAWCGGTPEENGRIIAVECPDCGLLAPKGYDYSEAVDNWNEIQRHIRDGVERKRKQEALK